MKILSCFDGISAAQQAFKNLGIEFNGIDNIYYSSEIDGVEKNKTDTCEYAWFIFQKGFEGKFSGDWLI